MLVLKEVVLDERDRVLNLLNWGVVLCLFVFELFVLWIGKFWCL